MKREPKIFLTDSSEELRKRKIKLIPANLTAMETDELYDLWKNRLFHPMMLCCSDFVGGYDILYDSGPVMEELESRGVKLL